MANNRLFIRNRKTGEYTGFLKSFGEGWEIRKTAQQIEEDVAELSDQAAFGNCFGAVSDLELVAESDPRYEEVDGLLIETDPADHNHPSLSAAERNPSLR